jgi:hypothetical protein
MPDPTLINLQPFGFTAVFHCRGRVVSSRFDGRRLLFLFGDRHTMKPFIRQHLLNVFELCKLGAISCVGVEGRPKDDTAPFPGTEVEAAFERLRNQFNGDVPAIIEGMLKWFGARRDFCFWKTLFLLRKSALIQPALTVESVEDEALNSEVARISN